MKRILVIEDTNQLRESISDALELEGYMVISAADGPSGIKLANENPPDLILCDIMMPGMDGFKVLQVLKKDNEDISVPFIFITALAERENFREGMELGAYDYLVKPFTIDELLKAINARLSKYESVENRIKFQIGKIENDFQFRISELNELIEGQRNMIRDISTSKTEIVEQLNQKKAQLMQDALHLMEINTKMEEMVRQLSVELKKAGISDEERILLTNLKNKISNKSVLTNSLTAFQLKFNETYPDFASRIFSKIPNLTQQDITLISAIFINLNTQQLSGIFGISPESVRKSKYRLKKKLGVDKDADLVKSIHTLTQTD